MKGSAIKTQHNDDMAFANKHFNSDHLWGRDLPHYERVRLTETISMIPSDVTDIIDLGCGDGRITNELSSSYNITGVDSSRAALRHLKTDKLQANIGLLPFPDNSFDLVLATEVIEHLPHGIFPNVLREMQRISKKYIMLTVPYRENRWINMSKCKKCKKRFHIDNHLHRFNRRKLKRLFANCTMTHFKLLSQKRLYYNTALLIFKYYFGQKWNSADHIICPRCGHQFSSHEYKHDNFFARIAHGIEWRLHKHAPSFLRRPTWALAIYQNKGTP